MGARFQRLPDGIVNGDALRVGQAAGEGLGFLRQIDHNFKFGTGDGQNHRRKAAGRVGLIDA
jgi:hypothetical protein